MNRKGSGDLALAKLLGVLVRSVDSSILGGVSGLHDSRLWDSDVGGDAMNLLRKLSETTAVGFRPPVASTCSVINVGALTSRVLGDVV